MAVNDLEAEKDFFVKYFNAKAGSKYSNFRNDFSNYFLRFSDGYYEAVVVDPEGNEIEVIAEHDDFRD